MATYYWVGGTGTWQPSDTTHWATSSGGTGGAGYPTSADNVIFDTASNSVAYLVTINGTNEAANVTIAGPVSGAVTFVTGTTPRLNVYGNLVANPTGVTLTGWIGDIYMSALSGTVNITLATPANFTRIYIDFASNAVICQIQIDLICNHFIINGGTVNTRSNPVTMVNNGSVTIGNGTRTTTFNYASSLITSSGLSIAANAVLTYTDSNSNGWQFSTPGYSLVNSSAYSVGNVTIGPFTTTGAYTITSAAGMRNFIVYGPSVPGYATIRITATVIVTNSITIQGGAGNRRVLIIAQSANTPIRYGSTPSITNFTAATLSDVDFKDIKMSSAVSGTRIGDCGGNTNVTFTAASYKWWVKTNGGNWWADAATTWVPQGGGSPSTDYFPLPQDGVVFFDGTLVAGSTVTVDKDIYIFALNFSTRNTAMTFATGSVNIMLGQDFQGSSKVTFTSSSGVMYLQPTGSNLTVTCNKMITSKAILIDAPSGYGEVSFIDDFYNSSGETYPSNAVTHYRGTLNVGANIYAQNFGSRNPDESKIRQLNLSTSSKFYLYDTYNFWNCSCTPGTYTANRTPQVYSTGVSANFHINHFGSDLASLTDIFTIDLFITNCTGIFDSAAVINKIDFTGSTTKSWTMYYGTYAQGDVILKRGMTAPGQLTLRPPSGVVQNIYPNGATFTAVYINRTGAGPFTGQVRLQGNMVLSNNLIHYDSGLDLNGYTLTVPSYTYSSSNSRSLTWGSGTIRTGSWSSNTYTLGMTYNNDAKLIIDNTISGTGTLSGFTGYTLPPVTIYGNNATTVTGTMSMADFTVSGRPIITFNAGFTYTFLKFSANGTDSSNRLTIQGSTSSKATLTKNGAHVYMKAINLVNITATGTTQWLAYQSAGTNTTGMTISPLAQTPPSVIMAFM